MNWMQLYFALKIIIPLAIFGGAGLFILVLIVSDKIHDARMKSRRAK